MKTIFITFAIFLISLLQGLMASKVNSEAEVSTTGESKHYKCGYRGYSPCRRGYYNYGGVGYYGWPSGFGHRGCYRPCYHNNRCC